MTKPMLCPMSFNNSHVYDGVMVQPERHECTPDCAWAVIDGSKGGSKKYGCVISLGHFGIDTEWNTRPLEDDAE